MAAVSCKWLTIPNQRWHEGAAIRRKILESGGWDRFIFLTILYWRSRGALGVRYHVFIPQLTTLYIKLFSILHTYIYAHVDPRISTSSRVYTGY